MVRIPVLHCQNFTTLSIIDVQLRISTLEAGSLSRAEEEMNGNPHFNARVSKRLTEWSMLVAVKPWEISNGKNYLSGSHHWPSQKFVDSCKLQIIYCCQLYSHETMFCTSNFFL